MKIIIKYFKMYGIYILIELLLAFILSILNLLGVNSSITLIINLVSNILIFFFYGFINGKKTNHKGLLEGLKTGAIMIIILAIMGLIFSLAHFTIATLLYYLGLLIISLLSSTIGKNKKTEITSNKM